jgi:hemerythrin-like domain-containing protein
MATTPTVPMADTAEMLMVHTMLRREFALLPDLVRGARPGDARRRSLIGAHIDLLCRILHAHHEGEDLVLWPLLLDRAEAESRSIIATMETQHQMIADAHDGLLGELEAWRTCTGDGNRIAAQSEALLAILTGHTALEEQLVLPLAAKHVTLAEWQKMGGHGMDTFPKRLLPLAFGMMMFQGDPEVIRRTLSTAPPAVRIALQFIAPRAFTRRCRRLHGQPNPPEIGPRQH